MLGKHKREDFIFYTVVPSLLPSLMVQIMSKYHLYIC